MNKIIIALLVLIVGAMAYIAYDNYLVEHPQPIASIDKTKGLVNVRRGVDAIGGQRGVLLYEGDQLSTNKNSYARLVMVDGSVLLLGAKTSLGLKQYQFNRDAKQVAGQLQMSKGALRLVTGRQAMPRSIVVSDARGSRLKLREGDVIAVGEDDALDVLLLSGDKALSVSNKHGKQSLSAGLASTLSPREAPTPAQSWPSDKVAQVLATVFEH